jgi:cytochrome b
MDKQLVRVWDLPTRLFHWLLVACITGLMVTAYVPGAWIEWHARLGYAVLALLLFRMVWGVVGGRWSRFTSFIYAPRSLVAYLRGRPRPEHLVGHTPLGALSVFAMLIALGAQVASGLVSDDEIAFQGPLNHLVSSSAGLTATWYHKDVGQWLLVGLVVLHLLAILFYALHKKNNLAAAMVLGDKPTQPGALVAPSRDDARSKLAAAVVMAVSAGAVVWLVA